MNAHSGGTGWGIGSLMAVIVSFLVKWEPVFSSLAAIVAIAAGGISIYRMLAKKKV